MVAARRYGRLIWLFALAVPVVGVLTSHFAASAPSDEVAMAPGPEGAVAEDPRSLQAERAEEGLPAVPVQSLSNGKTLLLVRHSEPPAEEDAAPAEAVTVPTKVHRVRSMTTGKWMTIVDSAVPPQPEATPAGATEAVEMPMPSAEPALVPTPTEEGNPGAEGSTTPAAPSKTAAGWPSAFVGQKNAPGTDFMPSNATPANNYAENTVLVEVPRERVLIIERGTVTPPEYGSSTPQERLVPQPARGRILMPNGPPLAPTRSEMGAVPMPEARTMRTNPSKLTMPVAPVTPPARPEKDPAIPTAKLRKQELGPTLVPESTIPGEVPPGPPLTYHQGPVISIPIRPIPAPMMAPPPGGVVPGMGAPVEPLPPPPVKMNEGFGMPTYSIPVPAIRAPIPAPVRPIMMGGPSGFSPGETVISGPVGDAHAIPGVMPHAGR